VVPLVRVDLAALGATMLAVNAASSARRSGFLVSSYAAPSKAELNRLYAGTSEGIGFVARQDHGTDGLLSVNGTDRTLGKKAYQKRIGPVPARDHPRSGRGAIDGESHRLVGGAENKRQVSSDRIQPEGPNHYYPVSVVAGHLEDWPCGVHRCQASAAG